MLPKHTPLAARKELSRRLHAAKAEKRLALGVDAETLRWRAMHPISPMNTIDEHTTTLPMYETHTGVISGLLFGNQSEDEVRALRARVESASAIITELLARTAKCDCRESDDAVAAAMAWLHDHTP